jgi:acetylornithine deacetylase/succinyl-diaminopimelate desuccinylase-like protein
MKTIETYLQANQARFVNELCEYLRLPSISAGAGGGGEISRCASWLVAHCRKIGLNAELCRTPGNPIVVARTPRQQGKRRPHYVIYGHYDVQPPDPLELWHSPPFQPRIAGRSLYARGAADNKGQHFAHLKAVEAYLKTGTPLPCDLTFVIEGEEEVGGPSLPGFLRRHRTQLRCEAVVISDTTMRSLRHPTLTYALRGVCGLEVGVHGPARDLHSGLFGGSIENPAMALCQLLGRLHRPDGRIAVPGFYDHVRRLSRQERAQLAAEPFDRQAYRRTLGVPQLFGEAGYTPVEQRTARPTLEINGLTSGYQGPGGKTIIPAVARAKLTMRLVPDQAPRKILALVAAHLRKICPPTVRLKLDLQQAGEPYLVSPRGPRVQAALSALQTAFGHTPVLEREGGSIPVVSEFKRILGADSLLLGLALPDANFHSPNEKLNLDVFAKGTLMSAWLWQTLPASEPVRHPSRKSS